MIYGIRLRAWGDRERPLYRRLRWVNRRIRSDTPPVAGLSGMAESIQVEGASR